MGSVFSLNILTISLFISLLSIVIGRGFGSVLFINNDSNILRLSASFVVILPLMLFIDVLCSKKGFLVFSPFKKLLNPKVVPSISLLYLLLLKVYPEDRHCVLFCIPQMLHF